MTEAEDSSHTWSDSIFENVPSLPLFPHDPPLPLSWLTSKERWPDYAEQMLEDLMIENRFFRYYKTKGESCRKMQAILQGLRPILDTTNWEDGRHHDLLQRKVERKLEGIRNALHKRGQLSKDGLVYQPSTGPAVSAEFSAFESAAGGLSAAEVGQALRYLGTLHGQARIIEEIATWQTPFSGENTTENPDASASIPINPPAQSEASG